MATTNQAFGQMRRDEAIEALRKAGPAGLNTPELARVMGMSRPLAWRYAAKIGAFKGATRYVPMTRWFACEEHAAAYVEKTDATGGGRQSAASVRRVAQVLVVLKSAGPAGLSILDAAKALEMSDRQAWMYLRKAKAEQGKTDSMPLIRWFHPDNKVDADAYVARINADLQARRERGRKRWSDERPAQVEALLTAAGAAGLLVEDASKALGVHRHTVGAVLVGFLEQGKTICRYDPDKRRRHWLVELAPPPPVKAPKERKKPGPKPAVLKPAKPAFVPPAKPVSAEPIYTKATKVTVCPTFTDNRFTPTRVEPFFSAMTPGSYLRTGSAIERAYT